MTTIDMDARYGYDDVGNVLTIADSPTTGARDTQCFTYDHLRRLTEAWSTASTTKTCADGVAQTGVSGAAPYHHSWSFDKVGNRQTETIHSLTGGVDTERDYVYPDQGEGQNQPHTLTRIDETGPAGDRTYRYRYDSAGNTVCRPNSDAANECASGTEAGHQALTWDAEGRLATSTPVGGQATTYVYDADGNRIARKAPGGATTLYLPGMDLAREGTVVSGTRFYSIGEQTIAVRKTTGVFFQAADHHDTATSSIDAATGAIYWRRTTPYGTTRDLSAPAFWPDEKGFVGGTIDPMTGLTHLGAREYDPRVGRFVSVDPIMDLGDPQQWSAYGYANGNPLAITDPTGMLGSASCAPGYVGGPGACTGSENGNGPDYGTTPTTMTTTTTTECKVPISVDPTCKDGDNILAYNFVHEITTCEEMYGPGTHDICAAALAERAYRDWIKGQEILLYIELGLTICGFAPLYGAGCDALDVAISYVTGDKEGAALSGAAMIPGLDGAGAAKVAELIGNYRTFRKLTKCMKNSFDGETLVLMADGSTKRISEVEVGDLVMAGDPVTGAVEAQPVTQVHVNTDAELTDVDLVRSGSGPVFFLDRGQADVLHTTAGHPVWEESGDRWVEAADLVAGESLLRGPDGTRYQVAAVRNFTGSQQMYNLSVAVLHTYFVRATEMPVLVHNSGCIDPLPIKGGQQAPGKPYKMSPDELKFVKELLKMKPNFKVFRTNGTMSQGDFVVIDYSNPKKPVGWVVELKSSSGGFPGEQFRNAGNLKAQFGLDKIEFQAGTPAEMLQALNRGRGSWN
ncbi:RHS repeat-associated core domain-containing protein [Catellatospora aurea]|uniref:RHS repeat-associated core domain-containing protein n=1 Tax=Catellatospora aurea TaxID=1337874 RepID=A0ABW2H5B2_9ACTN